MTPAKTAPSRRTGGPANRPPRRRNEVHVTKTLKPIIPIYLETRRRLRTRMAVYAPLAFLLVGIGLIASHVVLPIGVVGIGVVSAVIGLLVGVINLRVGSPSAIVRSLLARGRMEEPPDQLSNLLEGLCVGNGLPVPSVHIIEDPAANALCIGWSESTAALVITTGLLNACSRIELEGVLAHELAHIKLGDMRDAAFASVALGTWALIGKISSRLLGTLLQPAREAYADMGGASMTRYPPGLLRALVLIERTQQFRPNCLTTTTARLTAPLWLVNLAESTRAKPRNGELDLDGRIGLLAEL